MINITFHKPSLAFIILIFLGSCQEEEPSKEIVLYNKQLSYIKSHLQGKWELHYGKGGFISNNIQYYDSSYWKFDFNGNDRIEEVLYNTLKADTSILWYKGADNYAGDTYIMLFYDKTGVPWNYVVDGIYNDTLILKDYSSDAMFYHFTKYKP